MTLLFHLEQRADRVLRSQVEEFFALADRHRQPKLSMASEEEIEHCAAALLACFLYPNAQCAKFHLDPLGGLVHEMDITLRVENSKPRRVVASIDYFYW
ncbi:MAG TPA: hypothetical protein VGU01_03015 [Sphingomicrobium sp.]|nr:hypothetical protein [Sphingomicrobium sp.]